MQDLYGTDPTQESCAVDHADYYVAPTRPHKVDHTDHTDHSDQDYIYLP